MVTLLLVRHGESLYNMQRCFTGHSDIPLTELGEKQAELTAQYLTEHFKVDAIWSSDLQRAKSTAKPCADRLGLPINCDYRIEDMADIMSRDKKAEGSVIHFVLPAAVGDVHIVDLRVDEVVKLFEL